MWDSNSPLQLLKTMPKKLTKENLEKLQMVIDADKYKNSLISGFDLCGMYAPFCRGCKKTSIYPCAIAYINMLKAEGSDVEIDARPLTPAAVQSTPAENLPEKEAVAETAVASAAAEQPVEQAVEPEENLPVAEPVTVKEQPEPQISAEPKQEAATVEYPLPPQTLKRKIRIAIARKKL